MGVYLGNIALFMSEQHLRTLDAKLSTYFSRATVSQPIRAPQLDAGFLGTTPDRVSVAVLAVMVVLGPCFQPTKAGNDDAFAQKSGEAGPFAYLTNFDDGTVSVIDTASNTIVATVNVGSGPYGVAVSPDGAEVYVANSGSDNVSVIETANHTVTDTVNVGDGPQGLPSPRTD